MPTKKKKPFSPGKIAMLNEAKSAESKGKKPPKIHHPKGEKGAKVGGKSLPISKGSAKGPKMPAFPPKKKGV